MRTQRYAASSNPAPGDPRHMSDAKSRTGHTPVLLQEVISLLTIQPDHVVLDATLGGAGHAYAIAQLLGKKGHFLGLDADTHAVDRAHEVLIHATPRVTLETENFRNLSTVLQKHKVRRLDRALFDLGWSGYQLRTGRGFSFLADEPLLMTYGDPKTALFTAADIVNNWSEEHIKDVIEGWGEERFAPRIAHAIIFARKEGEIKSSTQLARIVEKSVPAWYRHRKIHPATKTFQAFRIAINDEIGALQEGLQSAREHLSVHGRIAVITFHSIEDRFVKRTFLEWQRNGYGRVITKKVVTPTRMEIIRNPRARSAKLRVFEKL